MARRAKIIREEKKLKHRNQYHNRCRICGRSHGYIRFFGLCRLCFLRLARTGVLPGVRKASW